MKVNTNAPSYTGISKEVSNKDAATDVSIQKSKSGEANKTAQSGEAARSSSDVEISEQARLFKAATEMARQNPEIRSEKVEALKQRIRSGTYQVDAAAVADKLLEEHLNSDFGKNNL